MLKPISFLSTFAGVSCLLAVSLSAQEPGSLDPEFTPTLFGNEVMSLAIDGQRVLVGGWFTSPAPYLAARLIEGGSDPTFSIGSGPNAVVRSLAVRDDRAIYVAGSFTSFDGTPRKDIALLSESGALDPNFDPGTGFNNRIERIIPLPDGKVLVAGAFSSVQGQSQAGVARLNSDGSRDAAFGATSGTDWTVNDMIRLDDGRIIIGGLFGKYNGVSSNRIAALNADGTLDETFEVGSGFNGPVTALLLTGDGQILVAGSFSSYNGMARNRLALLNADGTLDQSFDAGSGPNGTVNAMAEDSIGRVIIGGGFTSYDGADRFRIARVKKTGALDLTFEPGTGANSDVNAIVDLGAEDRLLIGGSFTSYDGASVSRYARIIGGGAGDSPGGFPTWVAGYFPDAGGNQEIVGPDADPDGDNFSNLAEYALGGDPTVAGTAQRPSLTIVSEGGEDFLEISFVRRQEAWDVIYVVEVTNDLSTWTDLWTSANHPYNSTQEQITQTVRDDQPMNGSRFIRLALYLDENAPPGGEGMNAWLSQFFDNDQMSDPEISGPNADPDKDGVPNLLEYAFNRHPLMAGRDDLPEAAIGDVGGQPHLSISFIRLRDSFDITYRVQASPDLNNWTEIWSSATSPYPGEEPSVVQTVEDTEPMNSGGTRFLRVDVLFDDGA